MEAVGHVREAQGNLLLAQVDALVNTVNCVGVMGKGIALQFKKAFPFVYASYKDACERHEVRPGSMHVVELGSEQPRYVINFPTKRHWKGRTKIEDVEVGLLALVREIRARGIRSIAVPPLGCGNGGLDWHVVRPRMLQAFAAIPEVDVRIYPPGNTPAPADIVVNERAPELTRGRAALVTLLDRYGKLAAEAGDGPVTLVEAQKLAYFLQCAGEPLNLEFEAHHFGPYSDALRRALRAMDMHFIVGFGDGTAPRTQLRTLPHATAAARALLDSDHADTYEAIADVIDLVNGFQSPYGLELLATVHWVAHDQAVRSADQAVQAVHAWSKRKADRFPAEHVEAAWEQLAALDWIVADAPQPV